jgi:uncharacterized protein (DUF1778 family)
MTFTYEKEVKADRLEVRLSAAAKSLLSYAAQIKHTTLTDFMVSSAMKAATDVLVSPRVFEIGTEEGWDTLMTLLDDPANAEPKPELVALFESTP